ncbi:phage/plasmid replication protein, II/X family [Comamonas sp.]|uniref:phage/plasmid replication protein, II/X family n=1 Tax=Comamonas sp. TaxID=34028 RepID=UPI0028B14880|nr:phage/plasmid replication protein, II/X family [Comamonas sp.]
MTTTSQKPRTAADLKDRSLTQEENLAQHTTPEEIARAAPNLPKLLKKSPPSPPFCSSLIDTVKMRVTIQHPNLAELAKANANLKQTGSAFLLTSPTTGAVARIFSRQECSALLIELSLPKWLTGQNIIGGHSMHPQCLAALKSVFKTLGFLPSKEERKAIVNQKYMLSRADVVVHVDCITDERASAVMAAIRALCLSVCKDFSCYGTETVYVGQHSKRRTLKIYRKDLEVQKYGLPSCVMNRGSLLENVEGLVRIELTLRQPELERLAIANPSAWQPSTIPPLLNSWIDALFRVSGQVTNVDAVNQLNAALQSKLNAWLRGDTEAFTRNVTRETTRSNRRDILKITGIDVALPLEPEWQRRYLHNIRTVLADGFGYRDHCKLLEERTERVAKR